MKKKIGILTLGLKDNYGGILQALALNEFLLQNGFEPILIRKYPIENAFKLIIKKVLENIPYQNIKGLRMSKIKYTNNLEMIKKYIKNMSPIMTTKKSISNWIDQQNLYAIIVGSDQVWRYSYINDTEYDTYFLNIDGEKEYKKIAYAASFGIDKWEKIEVQDHVSKLLQKFDAISVREKSGKEVCFNNFKIDNVSVVLDPTLLIGKKFFENMIKDLKVENFDCVSYVLDKNSEKQGIIDHLNTKYLNKNCKDLLSKSSCISIPSWVAYLYNANMVITDSFHGMVFSILFNKEFFVMINKDRGEDRFISICQHLGLMDRLIYSENDKINFDSIRPINYEKVNLSLADLRRYSSKFLLTNLNKD